MDLSALYRSILTIVFATSLCIAQAGPTVAGTLGDGAIIAIYNQVNTFDIETAGLGIARGHDPEVVALAKMVQKDHTGVRQMATDLAAKLEVDRSLPGERAEAAAEHARVLATLAKLSGPPFERAYLEHEITFHTAAIKAVKEVLIPAAHSAELKDLMEQVLPGFEHHLAETKRVAKTLK